MEGVREYLLSVIAGAILCGILSALIGDKGSLAGLNKLLCGLFLCTTVIAPLAQVKIGDFSNLAADIMTEGESAVREGQEDYDQAMRQIITDETRAYIMDKARSYGAEIEVEITLSRDNPPVPVGCVISGALSPYVRQQLKKVLSNDLGIPEENQSWMQ